MAINKTKHGDIEVLRGPLSASFVKDGRVIATARIVRKKWLLSISGQSWPVTPDMETSRFNQIPGDKITTTTTKAFPSFNDALSAVRMTPPVPGGA